MHTLRKSPQTKQRQRGAAFIVMLVIMVIGVTAVLIGSLSAISLHTARDRKTADALAQAREALIARAVADAGLPGSLPCPDTTGTGSADTATDCPNYIGRLPWKTLGLPDLRDGTGAPLWYALSRNFRDAPTTNIINSDSAGSLVIAGSPSANNVVAIVFAPGPSLSAQSRSDTQTAPCTTTNNSTIAQSLCAANYLEGNNANPSPAATPNTQYVAGDASDTFNDRLIYITADSLLPSVEKRVVREIKQCLDDYAAVSGSKYPWAAPMSPVAYTTTSNTLFGRIPDQPTISVPFNINTNTDPKVVALRNALSNLQAAETACQTNDNLQAALTAAANALLTATSNLNYSALATANNSAKAAANAAIPTAQGGSTYSQPCDYIDNHNSANAVQTNLNAANSNFPATVPEDLEMQANWTATCVLFSPPTYWTNSWKQLVLYRVSNPYRPLGNKTCGTSCLTIDGNGNPNQGSGSYRATVIGSGKNLNQTARVTTNVTSYLEGANSAVASTTTLETWQKAEQESKVINDFVVCLDGKGADQNSKCY